MVSDANKKKALGLEPTLTKGLLTSVSPVCTLSQNGYSGDIILTCQRPDELKILYRRIFCKSSKKSASPRSIDLPSINVAEVLRSIILKQRNFSTEKMRILHLQARSSRIYRFSNQQLSQLSWLERTANNRKRKVGGASPSGRIAHTCIYVTEM